MSKKSPIPLKIQLRFYVGDEIALGSGKADLLDAIRKTGSISQAAKSMAMSYRRAWVLVDTMNTCFTRPLVESIKGGKDGGGAHLTTFGEEVLQQYRTLQNDVQKTADAHAKRFYKLLKK